GTLTSGALTFEPGETVKRIFPTGLNLPAEPNLRLVLSDPVHGELTGRSEITFAGSLAQPLVSCAVVGAQIDLAHLESGVPVTLSVPSALEVRVNYDVFDSSGSIASGTLVFAPGQTV